jgi:AcrR family transcriptional regulator
MEGTSEMTPRYKRSEREDLMSETRQQLLEAAAQAFAGEGYNGANVNSVSQAAGFAKGTIYNYFHSKRALMLALISETAAAHFDYVAEQVQQASDPVRRLEAFFEAGFAWVVENSARARTMFITLNGPDVEFRTHMFEAYQPMFQLVAAEIIAPGIEEGPFRPVDPVSTAGLLMTIYLGTASQWDEQGQPWVRPAMVADFVLNGLRK